MSSAFRKELACESAARRDIRTRTTLVSLLVSFLSGSWRAVKYIDT
jgi:hypothetical protein